MHLVIDADQLCYAAGFATEGEPLSHTLHTVNQMLEKQLRETNCETHQCYIGGVENFRHDIAMDYKATRTARKPSSYENIREHLIHHWNAIVVDGMEVDDMVSLLLWGDYVTAGGDREVTTLILSSPDKDLKNTPGWHYAPRTGDVYWIGEVQAYRHFLFQMLTGDRTDNIRGLPDMTPGFAFRMGLGTKKVKGCGEVWAKKLMALSTDIEEAEINVYRAYLAWGEESGMSEDETYEYMRDQGQLLWMVRELDLFDKPIMWLPNTGAWHEGRRREAVSTGRSGDYRLPEEEGGATTRDPERGGHGCPSSEETTSSSTELSTGEVPDGPSGA